VISERFIKQKMEQHKLSVSKSVKALPSRPRLSFLFSQQREDNGLYWKDQLANARQVNVRPVINGSSNRLVSNVNSSSSGLIDSGIVHCAATSALSRGNNNMFSSDSNSGTSYSNHTSGSIRPLVTMNSHQTAYNKTGSQAGCNTTNTDTNSIRNFARADEDDCDADNEQLCLAASSFIFHLFPEEGAGNELVAATDGSNATAATVTHQPSEQPNDQQTEAADVVEIVADDPSAHDVMPDADVEHEQPALCSVGDKHTNVVLSAAASETVEAPNTPPASVEASTAETHGTSPIEVRQLRKEYTKLVLQYTDLLEQYADLQDRFRQQSVELEDKQRQINALLVDKQQADGCNDIIEGSVKKKARR
jgi:hypothetical protein